MLRKLIKFILGEPLASPDVLIGQAVECLHRHETLPPGVDDEAIDELSGRIGMPVPAEYRQLLKLTNGPPVGGQILLGVGKEYWNIEECLEWEPGPFDPDWISKGWFPIAADGCGDYYVVPTKHEFGPGFPVLFIDQCDYSEPSYVAASSVSRFLSGFIANEYDYREWPFDKHRTLASDPDIVRFSSAHLPWEA